MSPVTKPPRLRPGDRVATVTTSWAGPHLFPAVFEAGVATLTDTFGLEVVELPATRAPAADPRARAADLNAAFADDSIRAVIASIGGDDSALILAHLDTDLIRSHPKILMGYSDTTTQTVFAHRLGLVTFNGPSVMAGFAQLGHFPEAAAHVRSVLFEPTPTLTYEPFPHWSDGYLDWNEGHTSTPKPSRPHDGWHWLQGSGTTTGRLFGGCVEVLEFLKGTRHWPDEDFWIDRILFLELSEVKSSVDQVRYWLFNYGLQGVFDRVSALLIGRARDHDDDEKRALDEGIVATVAGQFGARDLPIVTNLDFGHTDPQWILPLGITAELDCDEGTFRLLEPAVER